jgi:hypothetical protein
VRRFVRWQNSCQTPDRIHSRQRISEKLLILADVWEAHGKDVLTKLAVSDPGKLATIAYGLLPRDVFISVEQKTPGNLEPEAWATLRRVLDLIETCKVEGDPQEVFAAIEDDLRARMSRQVTAIEGITREQENVSK